MIQTTEQILALAADTGAVAYSPPPLRAVRGYSFTYDALEAFYHAAIKSYKAELLKEVGEPVAGIIPHSFDVTTDQEWVKQNIDYCEPLYHSDQVAAAIQHYKDSLLKEVGDPVAYMTTDEEGSASMLFFDRHEALKYSGDDDPVNLFTESRIAELEAETERLKDEQFKRLEKEAEKRMKLREQLATAEQLVAEWQPIETAPRDGSWVLGWRQYATRPRIIQFDADYEEWANEDGEHVYSTTHWMPLPEAPKGEQK